MRGVAVTIQTQRTPGPLTKAQTDMLRTLVAFEGDEHGGFWEYVNDRDGALAARNADRVIGALQRRGFVTPKGEDLGVTDAGRAALAKVTP